MKFVKKEEAQKIINSDTSYLLEYSKKLDDKDMDFCINTIQGRYPEKGYCSNLKCKEIAYILEGKGTIHKRDEQIDIKDVVLDVFESNRIKADQRDINIDLDIESAVIMANKEKITEVVNNFFC